MRFSNRTVLVTGAARGQGKSHSLAFAIEGADLILVDVAKQIPGVPHPLGTAKQLEEVVAASRKLGRKAIGVNADLSQSAEVKSTIAKAIKEFGKIDIAVIQHAIVTVPRLTHEITEEEWDLTHKNDLKSYFLLAKEILPHMMQRKYGRIIMTSSDAGYRGIWGIASYTAAKHGVIGLVRNMSQEYAPWNITVNAVCPAAVNTPMTDWMMKIYPNWYTEKIFPSSGRTSLFPGVDFTEPIDVTNAVLWLADDNSRFVTGIALPVDCGISAR